MKQKYILINTMIIMLMTLTAWFLASLYNISWQGIKPVIAPAPQDIAKLITENTTGMPLHLPAGFSISIYAKDLGSPRVIAFDPVGNMMVSITSDGKIVALKNTHGISGGTPDITKTLLSDLRKPHGLAFHCDPPDSAACTLFVAEENEIAAYDYNSAHLTAVHKKKIFTLPLSGGGHFTRTLGFGPDNRLYVSIGSSCNVCNESDNRRATIFSLNPDGSDAREEARGLRNAVFFTWNPADEKMWATEMGRDNLGDDAPPDEINIITRGNDYGWPVCYGKNIHDTDFDKNLYVRDPCADKIPSAIDLQAHSAPLGLAFVSDNAGWPEYRNNLFVAYHGSWNRNVPTGYKVVRIVFDSAGNYLRTEDFITGWLTADNSALGRPVDIVFGKDNAMYISDDKAGVIYRIVYVGDNRVWRPIDTR